jgi:hypothetical protein
MSAEEKYGVVAMLDALGVRDMTREEALAFLANRDGLLAEVEEEKDLLGKIRKVGARQEDAGKPCYVGSFADTLTLTWEVDPARYTAIAIIATYVQSLVYCGLHTSGRVANGFEPDEGALSRIMLRGAIAFGEFVEERGERPAILGPAVADCVNWYEKADWIGAMLTPECARGLPAQIWECELVRDTLLEYDVPAKRDSIKTYAVRWPAKYLDDGPFPGRGIDDAKRDFRDDMDSLEWPAGTETKRANTERFFNDCIGEG